MSTCHGPNCTSSDLVEAHIIPRSFATFIRGDDPKLTNVQLTIHSDRAARPQLGEYDTGILCGVCDGVLGKLDDYAIGVARDFPRVAVREGAYFIAPDIDGDKLAKFFLSVIWRASISSRPNYSGIELGPYTNVVRDLIFSNASMEGETRLQVALERLVSTHLDASKMFTVPVRSKLGGFNGYGFMLGGFRVYVKVDNRALPGDQRNGLLKGRGLLRLYSRTFEQTSEFDATAEMVVAAHHRKTA